jgi:shikimate kinase/3-dehydroquinate synthase
VVTARHAAPPSPLQPVATRVALVGLSGTGKSAVGRALARRLGWSAVDTDTLVEAAAGSGVAEIFAAEGEAGFRARELAALEAALGGDGAMVIATGGGIVTQPRALELLLGSCCVVWLDGPDSLLAERVGAAADRPLLADDPRTALARLREQRAELYARAHLRVDVRDGDVEDICDRVEDVIRGARVRPLDVSATPPAAASAPEGSIAVRIDLGERGYDVLVGSGITGRAGSLLPPETRRVAVIADHAVLPVAREVLAAVRAQGRTGSITAVRGGERLKTWGKAGRLVDRLARLRLERGDCVIAVGGGTVGDVAGFAAASYLRGIAVLQVPTTLLAMVDSAIGGKTGVNLSRGKNLAGAFWQPHAVLCDLDTLRTLARRPYLAAMAEILKYAMILPAPELVATLDQRLAPLLARDPATLRDVVAACCALKAEVVVSDERESGRRALLNYGHTAGHALEAVTGYDRILHGEAVAIGMRVAGALSVAACGCPAADIAWQDELLARCGLGVAGGIDPGAVLERTAGDKKVRGGVARWVLLEARGRARSGVPVPDAAVRSALEAVIG